MENRIYNNGLLISYSRLGHSYHVYNPSHATSMESPGDLNGTWRSMKMTGFNAYQSKT